MDAPRNTKITRPRKEASPKPDPGRDAWILLLQLLRAEQGALLAVWAEFGLSSAQGDLLCSLQPERPSTMVSIAKELNCHDSNVTGLIDKLEQRGLVERRSDPKDRRVNLIVLTPPGIQLREQLLLRIYAPLPFIATLPVRDKRLLRDLLQRATERKAKIKNPPSA
jgi:DNA-binding MarR family transcriptional regulator